MRDIREFEALHPQDAGLSRWAKSVRRLYVRTKAGALLATRGRLAMERRLLSMCRPFLNDPLAPQSKLCRRIERFIKELFVFSSHAQAPPDNNAAERSLRHPVVSRKVSGSTRSPQGTDSRMALASLFGSGAPMALTPSHNAKGCSFPLKSEQLLADRVQDWLLRYHLRPEKVQVLRTCTCLYRRVQLLLRPQI